MNVQVASITAELDQTRRTMREKKRVIQQEASPSRRFKRSWSAHQWLWIGSVVALGGVVGIILGRRRRVTPDIPKGYVVVPRKPESSAVWSTLKLAASLAQPVVTAWAKRKTAHSHNGNGEAPFHESERR